MKHLALVLIVFGSCSAAPSTVDGGASGGGLAGTGSGAAGGLAGGAAGGGIASAGGSAGGGAAGGSSAVDAGVSFCAEMEAGSSWLRTALMACSEVGDMGIYAFNATRCAMESGTACSPADQQVMRGVAACEKAITPCASAADRMRVTSAVNTCVSNIMVSSACLASLQ